MLIIVLIVGLVLIPFGAPGAQAAESSFSAGTAFTYQGSLRQDGRPAEGAFDLSFGLFDSGREGKAFGQIDLFDVPVRGGAFTVELDFLQPIYSGEPFWLETEVRVAGSGTYSRLEPRDLLLGKAGSACAVDNDVLISGTLEIQPLINRPGLEIACCNEADLEGGGQIALHGDALTDPAVLRIDYDEIQSSLLGQPDHLQLNPHGGNIGLGVSNPAAPVHVPPGPGVTTSGGGSLVIGYSTNISLDQNEIQAHAGGAPGTLFLNRHGGNIGLGVSSPTAPVHTPPGPDVTASGGGALVVGLSTNIAIDSNEIQAHVGGAPGTLYLNHEGGNVRIGGLLDIGLESVVVETDSYLASADCPAGKKIFSGGCNGINAVEVSFPFLNGSGWYCQWDDTDRNSVYAICGRVAW